MRKPAYEVIAGTPVKNRQGPSSMTFMSRNLVPESNAYVEGGWVWGMPDPNPIFLNTSTVISKNWFCISGLIMSTRRS